MKADEQRLQQLIDTPDRDALLETDIPLIRAGLLHLNWTDRPEGRVHPFVTASPVATKYFGANQRLTPAHRRTLRDLAEVKAGDVAWAKDNILPQYA